MLRRVFRYGIAFLVGIDFTASTDHLRATSAASDEIPFDVVGSTSVFGPCFGDGPNGMIHRYFNPNIPYPTPQSDRPSQSFGFRRCRHGVNRIVEFPIDRPPPTLRFIRVDLCLFVVPCLFF